MVGRRLLVSDIDGTLIGDDAALGRFVAWWAKRPDDWRLVYATGRHLPSVDGLITAGVVPVPDAVISAVGSEIHEPTGRAWPGWREHLGAWDASAVRRVLANDPRLTPQSDDAQTPVKVSYEVDALEAKGLADIEGALERAGLSAIVIHSQDRFLDVLPAAAGKGQAARFLATAWGFEPWDVLTFGDSGNDLDLFRHGFRGTLVGNALPELRAAVGPEVYHSPEPFAAGVLDGIRHWSVD